MSWTILLPKMLLLPMGVVFVSLALLFRFWENGYFEECLRTLEFII